MVAAPLPPDEEARLEQLHGLQLLDTLPEEVYDDLTFLAQQVAGAPIALVTLVDRERQWFKSIQGFDLGIRETPRDVSICAHAILEPDRVLELPDLAADPRFADNPLVVMDGGIRSYAGAPLVTSEGHALGTLCVVDHVRREFDEGVQLALQALARQVIHAFELRQTVFELRAAALVRARQEEQLREYREQLEANLEAMAERAIRDALTGLYNRAALEDRLAAELAAHKRVGRNVAVLMIDLDHFKQRNDEHGHAAGDEALRRVAEVLDQGVRDADMAARYGGEEFTVILSETPLGGAMIAAERLRAAIAAIDLDSGPLTASIGLAVAGPEWDDPDSILHAADEALYAAKRAGRNICRVAHASVLSKA